MLTFWPVYLTIQTCKLKYFGYNRNRLMLVMCTVNMLLVFTLFLRKHLLKWILQLLIDVYHGHKKLVAILRELPKVGNKMQFK